MRKFLYILFLAFVACSSTKNTASEVTSVTAELVPIKVLRHFDKASYISADQFRNFFVIEAGTQTVVKFSPEGDSLRAAGGFGSDHNQFIGPNGIDARLTNSIFISDNVNNRIEQYTKDLNYSATLYTHDYANSANRFGLPQAVAADQAGNIYVADGENKRVVKARPDYSIERVIGGYSDATRPDAVLANPIDLAIGGDGQLIVLDGRGTSSLVEYDALGNLLARRSLGDEATRITSVSDTIFALLPRRSEVQLFRSSGLTPIGRWAIRADKFHAGWPIIDIAARGGTIYGLSPTAVYLCRVKAITDTSVGKH